MAMLYAELVASNVKRPAAGAVKEYEVSGSPGAKERHRTSTLSTPPAFDPATSTGNWPDSAIVAQSTHVVPSLQT
jgi:hypothetical protein